MRSLTQAAMNDKQCHGCGSGRRDGRKRGAGHDQ
jgi:hypothetical protein